MQELAYCSPKNAMCVANQTLKSQKCQVPCEGVYADMPDDLLGQKLDRVYAVVQEKVGGSILNILSFSIFVGLAACVPFLSKIYWLF